MERLDDAGHLGSTKKRVFKAPRKKTFHLINSFKLQNTLSQNPLSPAFGKQNKPIYGRPKTREGGNGGGAARPRWKYNA